MQLSLEKEKFIQSPSQVLGPAESQGLPQSLIFFVGYCCSAFPLKAAFESLQGKVIRKLRLREADHLPKVVPVAS